MSFLMLMALAAICALTEMRVEKKVAEHDEKVGPRHCEHCCPSKHP